MKNFTYGMYSHLSMTNIDLAQIEGEENIDVVSVHEYTHAYLVKSTAYGSYLMSMRSINKLYSNNQDLIKKSDNKFLDNHRNKCLVFEFLNQKMLKVQEYTATLVELLYMKYKYGNEALVASMEKISEPSQRTIYAKCLKTYGYILKDDFLLELYQFVIQSPNIISQSYINILSKKNSMEAAIDVGICIILQIAINSLNIDLTEIDKKHWKSKSQLEKYVSTNIVTYEPSVRFCRCIDKMLPKNKSFNLSYPEDIYVIINNLGYQEYLTDYIKENYEMESNIGNDLKNNAVDEMYFVQGYDIRHAEELEKVALYTAMPAILNKTSIYKFINKTNIKLNNLMFSGEESSNDIIIKKFDVLHIHPATGKKNKFTYLVGGSLLYNLRLKQELSKLSKDIEESDIDLYEEEIESWCDVQDILRKFDGTLYLSGCPRSEHILDWIKENNIAFNKIIIYSASSLQSSISFIKGYFNNSEAILHKNIFSPVLILKQENSYFLQTMVCDFCDIISEDEDFKSINLYNLRENQLTQDECILVDQILKENYLRMANSNSYVE